MYGIGMKKNRMKRRQVVVGCAATTALAAMPFKSQVAKSQTLNSKNSTKKHSLARSIKAAVLPNQSFAYMVFSRLGFGITPGIFDEDTFNALGNSNSERLENFVDQQLAGGVDVDVNERMASTNAFHTLNKTLPELWYDHLRNPVHGNGPMGKTRPILEAKFEKCTPA